MKNTAYIAGIVTLATLFSSCSKQQKKEGEDIPEVTVAEAVEDSVTTHKSYPAYLTADQKVDLVARVNGYLISKPYTAGDMVQKGTLLFTIESTTYADDVRQAQAQLANAKATYAYASNHYTAMQRALTSDAVSQMEVLQAKSNMETAQAAIASAQAQLQAAQTTLSYCTVHAPFTGRITSCNFSDGAYLAGAGSPVTLATIYDDSKMTVNFNVDDDEYQAILDSRDPKTMRIDLRDIPVDFDIPLTKKYTAYISYVAPAINQSTGAMKMEAKILNPDGELRAGMYCTIHMPNEVLSKAILVRDASIGTDQLGKFLYTVNDSNKVVYTPIKVGELVNDTMRIVTDGLKPNTRYVTQALLKVRDGMPVKPVLKK